MPSVQGERPEGSGASAPSVAGSERGRALAAPHARALIWIGIAAVLAAGTVAYWNSFGGVYHYDDEADLLGNPNLHSFSSALSAPAQTGLDGRPVASLTFALNYALSGKEIASYHALNLAIHLLAALALFGVVRRTLLLPSMRERLGGASSGIAAAIALLWVAHPLQTASVTYVIQRVESLMGLFYLATLYCAVRSFTSPRALRWQIAAVLLCALGMGTKEVMVSAPLVVLLHDRSFAAGSFRRALALRRGMYAGLAACWLALVFLVRTSQGRSESVGFDLGVGAWGYAKVQAIALVRYLRLVLWPDPLIFDYGTPLARGAGEWLVPGIVVVALLVATLWALAKRPALGFLGASFFLVLAPTSSVLPIATERIAEHRMYLPLASVLALLVFAGREALARIAPQASRALGSALVLALTVALSLATISRNRDYHDSDGMWADVVAKMPENERGQFILGTCYANRGEFDRAHAHFVEAVRLAPENGYYRTNLATVLMDLGRLDESIQQFERAVELVPSFAMTRRNFGTALLRKGERARAAGEFQAALQLDPSDVAAQRGLANSRGR